MVCDPSVRDEVEHVATPVAGLNVTTQEAKGLPLSVSATVPDSFTELLLGVTVAVKVTAWLKLAGFDDEVRAVLLAAVLTVCVSDVCVVVKFGSPAYFATIV